MYKNDLARPKSLDDLVGLDNLKASIRVSMTSAIAQNKEFPHTLFYGGPGLGKSSIASIIAKERNSNFKMFLSDVFKKKEDVQNLLASLDSSGYDDDGNPIDEISPTVIFLDEIHQLPKNVQEALLQAMEDNSYTASKKNNLNGKEEKVVYWVPRFTLIGATTKPGQLEEAFVSRFKLSFALQLYTQQEISQIIKRYCNIKQVTISEEATTEIAKRSRGIARKCLNFVERCIDTAIYLSQDSQNISITKDIIYKSFDLLGIDENGLDSIDIQILTYLYKIYPQKIGQNRLASIIGVTETALKEIIEPYLLRQCLIDATPGGRIISELGMEYLEKYDIVSNKISADAGGKVPHA